MTTMNKIILESATIPHVDLDFMNQTHFEEVEMVKELGELLETYQQSDEPTAGETQQITAFLDKWLEHTKAHFARENGLMLEIGFPMIVVHKSEHEQVLGEMMMMVESWQTDYDIEAVAHYVFSLWPSWFGNHVNSMDMMTARFAVMSGYEPH